MEPDPEREAREALWRFKLRVQARADGRAAHQGRSCCSPSRREILLPPGVVDRLRGFLIEPAPVSNELPNFLSSDPEG